MYIYICEKHVLYIASSGAAAFLWNWSGEINSERKYDDIVGKWNRIDPLTEWNEIWIQRFRDGHFVIICWTLFHQLTACYSIFIRTSEHWMPRFHCNDNPLEILNITYEATKLSLRARYMQYIYIMSIDIMIYHICLFPRNPQNLRSRRTYCWRLRDPDSYHSGANHNKYSAPPAPGFTPQSIPIMRHFLGASDWWNAGPFQGQTGAGFGLLEPVKPRS